MSSLKTKRRSSSGCAFFLLGMLWSASLQAGSFQVSPVRVSLSADKPVSALILRNNNDQPTVVQLEPVSWSQQDGRDVYSPTQEILATPPIFTIPAGGSQVVRVGLRRPGDPHRELSYRLFMQELPAPPKPGFQGISVALRVGIPVFVAPAIVAAPVLRWRAFTTAQGHIKVSVANVGNAHVQVTNFKLGPVGSSTHPANRQAAAYVLPGQSRDWVVTTGSVQMPSTMMRLSAQTDAGDMEAEMMLENP